MGGGRGYLGSGSYPGGGSLLGGIGRGLQRVSRRFDSLQDHFQTKDRQVTHDAETEKLLGLRLDMDKEIAKQRNDWNVEAANVKSGRDEESATAQHGRAKELATLGYDYQKDIQGADLSSTERMKRADITSREGMFKDELKQKKGEGIEDRLIRYKLLDRQMQGQMDILNNKLTSAENEGDADRVQQFKLSIAGFNNDQSLLSQRIRADEKSLQEQLGSKSALQSDAQAHDLTVQDRSLKSQAGLQASEQAYGLAKQRNLFTFSAAESKAERRVRKTMQTQELTSRQSIALATSNAAMERLSVKLDSEEAMKGEDRALMIALQSARIDSREYLAEEDRYVQKLQFYKQLASTEKMTVAQITSREKTAKMTTNVAYAQIQAIKDQVTLSPQSDGTIMKLDAQGNYLGPVKDKDGNDIKAGKTVTEATKLMAKIYLEQMKGIAAQLKNEMLTQAQKDELTAEGNSIIDTMRNLTGLGRPELTNRIPKRGGGGQAPPPMDNSDTTASWNEGPAQEPVPLFGLGNKQPGLPNDELDLSQGQVGANPLGRGALNRPAAKTPPWLSSIHDEIKALFKSKLGSGVPEMTRDDVNQTR